MMDIVRLVNIIILSVLAGGSFIVVTILCILIAIEKKGEK
jgi:hypothetical protein